LTIFKKYLNYFCIVHSAGNKKSNSLKVANAVMTSELVALTSSLHFAVLCYMTLDTFKHFQKFQCCYIIPFCRIIDNNSLFSLQSGSLSLLNSIPNTVICVKCGVMLLLKYPPFHYSAKYCKKNAKLLICKLVRDFVQSSARCPC
jgi:ABC-type iron transport system FetAB permease component